MLIRRSDPPTHQVPDTPIVARRIVSRDDSEKLGVTWMTIDGDHFRCRITVSDVVYAVLEGSGWFEVGDGPRETVGPGDFVFVAAGTPYAYGGMFSYLNIQAPARRPGEGFVREG